MDTLISHGNIPGRKAMVEILETGLKASDPHANTKGGFHLEDNKLIIGREEYVPTGSPKTGEEVFDLNQIERIFVVGAGKGIQHVAKGIEDALGERLTGGHVVDKKGHPIICKKIGVTLGSHPTPDADCVKGCEKIYALIKGLAENDLVITCVANGVSSLLTMPVAGITIDEVKEMTYIMQIKHGVPTSDLNAVRNHIDVMKGGRISRYIHPAKAVHILAIDPGNYRQFMYENRWLHTLAEGTTFQTAIDSIKRWDAWDEVPASIKNFLLKADPEFETVKADEFEKWGNRIFGVMPGFRQTAKFPPAMKRAEELGFKPIILTDDLRLIEASHAGTYIAAICRTIERAGYPFAPPCAIFSSGEMVVTVGNKQGIGGRNQEFALSAALGIGGSKNIVIGSVDTDGTDGPGTQFVKGLEDLPSCLAGGIVDGETLAESRKAGVNIIEEMKRHNTSPTVWKLKSGVWVTPNISLIDFTVALVMGRS